MLLYISISVKRWTKIPVSGSWNLEFQKVPIPCRLDGLTRRYLHDVVQIVHCDVKPDNLLLRRGRQFFTFKASCNLCNFSNSEFVQCFCKLNLFLFDVFNHLNKFWRDLRELRFFFIFGGWVELSYVSTRLGRPGSKALRLWNGKVQIVRVGHRIATEELPHTKWYVVF